MNGALYDGMVVKISKVPAAPGASATIDVSEVVYVHPKPFVAANESVAQNVISAAALAAVKELNFADPVNTVEVKIRKWA